VVVPARRTRYDLNFGNLQGCCIGKHPTPSVLTSERHAAANTQSAALTRDAATVMLLDETPASTRARRALDLPTRVAKHVLVSQQLMSPGGDTLVDHSLSSLSNQDWSASTL
jgi:hypothetical protein